MHIGGFNLNKEHQQIKKVDTMNEGILKEINKNTSSAENFKVNKKHKLGHGKKLEPNVLYGRKQ